MNGRQFSEGVLFGRASILCREHQQTAIEGTTDGCPCARRRLTQVLSARLQAQANAPVQKLDELRAMAAAEVSGRGE